ncbi:adenosylcobinamide-phosphate synthase CbiB [Halomonas korlensis]|uniref:Cobalamin biosynthesis protein CobD n=1 Tax=Halomonas korlensis TaxID=463301 RepID=A0A1I7JNB0_9GAMM|nr:adenosylcobinamide-phosphate synthase CbiB [Halomonas korlensis]SFU86664.1 adenosylcobinamide-phosphate synthase [Halomonas korlensis]
MVTVEPLTLWGLWLLLGAIVVDLLVGDPPAVPHPVVAIGKLISQGERLWNRGPGSIRRRNGLMLTVGVVIGVYLVTWAGLLMLSRLHAGLALVAELWLLSTTLSIKGLGKAARAVTEPLRHGQLPAARRALGMIVGRDTADLQEREIARATVETVAENTVDGITAPLFWALIGGAPLALAYKAVNTLDSMIGYRNKRYTDFGFAAARLDDLVNWLPARLTALCLWLAALVMPGMHRRAALAGTWRDAPGHPSPNAGWPEAMVAWLLGVQLGGTSTYAGVASHRPTLGVVREPLGVAHIPRAVLMMHGGWVVFTLLMILAVLTRQAWL